MLQDSKLVLLTSINGQIQVAHRGKLGPRRFGKAGLHGRSREPMMWRAPCPILTLSHQRCSASHSATFANDRLQTPYQIVKYSS